MTERDRRPGSGGTEDNVRDELDEAAGVRRKSDVPEEETEGSPGSGGVKDNVRDELDETQER